MAVPREPAIDSTPVTPESDPMRELFGPGSGNTLIATEGDDSYDIPEEVQAALIEHGLGAKRGFRCILRGGASGDGSTTQTIPYIKSWPRSIPTVEWIAKNYGPGEYSLVLSWRQKDDTGKDRNVTETIPITISEHAQDEYDEYQLRKQIERAKRNNSTIRNARLRTDLETSLTGEARGEGKNAREAAKEYIGEFRELAGVLGWTGANGRAGFDWGPILAALLPALPGILEAMNNARNRQSEQMEKLMLLMLTQNKDSVGQLVELFKAQSGPSTGREMLNDFKEMVMGAIDVKEALKDKEETALDKVLGAIGQAAPFLSQLLVLRANQRAQIPHYKAAQAYMQSDPAFQAVQQNPELLAEMVQRLDAHYGWEQTDLILQAMQKERPSECLRDESQRYPAGDERNRHPEQETSGESDEAQTVVEAATQ